MGTFDYSSDFIENNRCALRRGLFLFIDFYWVSWVSSFHIPINFLSEFNLDFFYKVQSLLQLVRRTHRHSEYDNYQQRQKPSTFSISAFLVNFWILKANMSDLESDSSFEVIDSDASSVSLTQIVNKVIKISRFLFHRFFSDWRLRRRIFWFFGQRRRSGVCEGFWVHIWRCFEAVVFIHNDRRGRIDISSYSPRNQWNLETCCPRKHRGVLKSCSWQLIAIENFWTSWQLEVKPNTTNEATNEQGIRRSGSTVEKKTSLCFNNFERGSNSLCNEGGQRGNRCK